MPGAGGAAVTAAVVLDISGGVTLFFLLLRRKKKIPSTSAAMTAKPPTTPPAMAPAGEPPLLPVGVAEADRLAVEVVGELMDGVLEGEKCSGVEEVRAMGEVTLASLAVKEARAVKADDAQTQWSKLYDPTNIA